MAFGNQFNQNQITSSPNSDDNKRRVRWIGSGLLLLLGVLLLVNYNGDSRFGVGPQEVPYSQFLEQVESDQVSEATLSERQIQYQLKQGQIADDASANRITVPVDPDSSLTQLLREHDVEFSVVPADEGSWIGGLLGWLLFPLLFFVLWSFLLRRVQQSGGMSGGGNPFGVGQSRARLYSEGKTGVTFADVAGVDEAKAELQEVVDYLKNKDKYARLGAEVPKGVLLVGPPGTGKTLLGKAVAGEAGVPFFSISGSEFIELFVGVGASRVRDLFEQAKGEAPCIVFIDELDALGKSRGGQAQMASGGFNEQEQTLNQLLKEMDGFEPNTGVIILGATNRPEVLDPALQRPGRFDRQVTVDRPDKSGRKDILQVHIPKIKKDEDVDLDQLAARTSGFTGAELANLVNEAALLAARRSGDRVKMMDFGEAIERVIAGLQKKSRVLTDEEKRTVAYHESGHALIGAVVPGAGQVAKISIIPRGVGALGFTLQLPEEDRFLLGEDELRGRLMILLAGRSSEEVVFGKVSTGASDDIQKVTDLAKQYVTQYGMSSELGPIAFERPQGQYLPGMESPRREVSPPVAEAIDAQIKALVDGAHHMALRVLESNRDVLENMAQTLLREESIEAQALQDRLAQVKTPEELQEWLQTGHLSSGRDHLRQALAELDGNPSNCHN